MPPVKPTVAKRPDPLAAIRQKVQILRRQVPSLNEEEVWRAFLANHANGQTSTRAMGLQQLEAVVTALHAAGAPKRPAKAVGKPRFAATPQMEMIRALWIQLHDLAAVDSAGEPAIAAFVQRQTGQQMGQLAPAAANTVIEALKDWLRRAERDPVLPVKRAVLAKHGRPLDKARFIDGLWRALADTGAFPTAGRFAGLDNWMHRQGWPVAAPQFLTPEQQDAAITKLSTWLRRATRGKVKA